MGKCVIDVKVDVQIVKCTIYFLGKYRTSRSYVSPIDNLKRG